MLFWAMGERGATHASDAPPNAAREFPHVAPELAAACQEGTRLPSDVARLIVSLCPLPVFYTGADPEEYDFLWLCPSCGVRAQTDAD